jgi:hypothetical protein
MAVTALAQNVVFDGEVGTHPTSAKRKELGNIKNFQVISLDLSLFAPSA